MKQLTDYIQEHLDGPISNESLAAVVSLSVSHFGRVFKESFGLSPHQYVLRMRIDRAREWLLGTDASLGLIALECGLTDQAHFCRMFRRFEGVSPGAFRRSLVGAKNRTAHSGLPQIELARELDRIVDPGVSATYTTQFGRIQLE